MSQWQTGKNAAEDGDKKKPRWQKILELPNDTMMYDLSNGKRYRTGQFVPLFHDSYQTCVYEFRIMGTEEHVGINFLRLLGDKFRCSIMQGGY